MAPVQADRGRQANEAYEAGDYARAETLYREAIEENPADARLRFNLGNALAAQARFDEAIDAFEQFKRFATDPQSIAMAEYNIGTLLGRQQQWDEAAERFRTSLRENPTDSDAVHNFEYAMRMLQEEDQDDEQQDDDEQQQDSSDESGNGGSSGGQPQDGGEGSPGDAGDQPEDGDGSESPAQTQPADQQGATGTPQTADGQMSQQEAEQLLNALLSREQDLIRDFLRDLVDDSPSAEKDW